MTKRYIGDGVYVDFDGFALVLTTKNGISETNRIVLEPEVYGALRAFVERFAEASESEGGEGDHTPAFAEPEGEEKA